MNLEELNAMRYSDLLKLAKEKLNITRRVSKNMLVESLMQLERNLELQRNFMSDDDSDDDKPSVPEPQPEPVVSVVVKRGRKRSKKQEVAVEQQNKKSKNDSTIEPTTAAATHNSTFDAEKMEETLNTTFDVEEPKQKRSRGNKKSNPEPAEPKKVVAVASKKLKKSISEPAPSKPVTVEPKKSTDESQEKEVIITAGRKLKKSLSDPEPLKKSKSDEMAQTKKIIVANRKLKQSVFKVEPLVPKQQTASPVANVIGSGRKPFTPNLRRMTIEATSATPPLMKMPATPATVVKSVKKVIPTQQPLPITSSIPKRKAAPNFAEIHQKQFDKMQSVDEYVEKKKTRNEAIVTGSALKNKLNATTLQQTPAKTPAPAANANASQSKEPSLKFNFVSGIQKPVFTAQGLVAIEKKRVVATVKENLNQQQQPTATAVVNKPKGGASRGTGSRVSANASTLSLTGKQMIKGVRTNRRFELQMAHRNMKQQ